MLFTHKASKFREREHESRDGVRRSRHVDSYLYFPIVWSGSKGGRKKVIKGLKSGERKVGMVWGQRLCQSLYCVSMSPSSENTCSGSHEALEIGYPCHLTKY